MPEDPKEEPIENRPPFKVVTPAKKNVGGNPLVWIAVVVALGLIAAYAAGLLR